MRLTLRTMLAYLDDILEPADREEIGKKIEESEFARQLVQRIRDSARNPRLSAPKVSGKGGPDPNTVAEYLDNTLAGERVPDFEKLCLDSDVDLAEVAACHQILTMVLAQPADIDLGMKQHMYSVVDHSAQVHGGAEAGLQPGHALPSDEVWVKPRRRKPEVPDYLRDRPGGTKWKPILAAVILLLIVAGIVTVALGPLDRTHPIARLLGLSPAVENPPAANEAPKNQETAKDEHSNAGAEQHATSDQHATLAAETTDAGKAAKAADAAPNTPQTEGAAGKEPAAPETTATIIEKPEAERSNIASEAAATSPVADTQAPVNPTAASAPAVATPPENAATEAAAPSKAPATDINVPPPLPTPTVRDTAAAPIPPQRNRSVAELTQPVPAPTGPLPRDTTLPDASLPDASSAMEPTPPQPVPADNTPVGRLLPSKGIVLLKRDAASGQWMRVASGEAVTANEQLLVLPTYRPTITLSVGLTLQVPAETLLEFKAPDARGIPTVKLVYGRLVLMTTGKAGAQLGLELGKASGVVSFVDAEATLGVEVSRHFPAGVNPEAEEPRISADIYLARGHVEWTPTGGTATSLNAMQVLSLNQMNAPANATTAPTLPKWIDLGQLGLLDSQASEFLAQSLQDDKPLPVALREMVDRRKIEDKSLGAQCLAMLDEFEPLVAAFNDADQKPMWPVEIATVKAALARGSATAAKVHEAFVKQHGEKLGTDVYRMFLGYTKEQLQAGEAARLVDFLDSDSLDCRVLAFANLQEITNKTFNYRPDAPAASRATPLRRWQAELNMPGGIVPKEPIAK